MSAAAIAWLSLVVNGSVLALLFVRNPFRPSQYFSGIALFSFAVRPLASGACDYFTPFYYYEVGLYDQGVMLGNLGLTVFNFGLLVAARRSREVPDVAGGQLGNFADFLLIGAALLDLAALQLFGAAILPGVRTTGLQQAASGSQIFFAMVSAATVLGMGLSVLCFLTRKPGMSILRMVVRMGGFFLISMVFYQRGSLLIGLVFGLFLTAVHNRRFFTSNLARTMAMFAALLFVATLGRQAITQIVVLVEPSAAAAERAGPEIPGSYSCRIANVANQEHDQVWPTLLPYVGQYGADKFANVAAAIFRPFLSAAERDRLGLTTSVDSLNIYNDARSYLDVNFGFSISVIQYHYFSLGTLFVVSLALAGLLTSTVENAIGSGSRAVIDLQFMVRALLVLNTAYLLNAPFDEQLKWALINTVVGLLSIGAYRLGARLLFAGHASPTAGKVAQA